MVTKLRPCGGIKKGAGKTTVVTLKREKSQIDDCEAAKRQKSPKLRDNVTTLGVMQPAERNSGSEMCPVFAL